MAVVKKLGVDFNLMAGTSALTLSADQVCAVYPPKGTDPSVDSRDHSRTHDSGWTITGEIKEDYYTWVNEFTAVHPTFGKVWGDFEIEVFADSEEAYSHFYTHHPPHAWDYQDI